MFVKPRKNRKRLQHSSNSSSVRSDSCHFLAAGCSTGSFSACRAGNARCDIANATALAGAIDTFKRHAVQLGKLVYCHYGLDLP